MGTAKKVRSVITTFITLTVLLGFTQCELISSGKNDLKKTTSAPVIITTTSESNLINEITTYNNYSLLNSLSVQGVKTFNFITNEATNRTTYNITGDVSFSIELGMLTYNAATTATDVKGKIWLNGTLIDSDGSPSCFFGRTTLSRGTNYVAFVVYNSTGTAIGRSSIVKIECTIPSSIYRFELVWDGNEDLDLHIASADWSISGNSGSWHVYYNVGSRKYEAAGYDIELDTDSEAYGPENIRIFEIPTGDQFKCWIHYHSGSWPSSPDIDAAINLYMNDSPTPTHSWSNQTLNGGVTGGDTVTLGTWTAPNTLVNP